MQTPIKHMVTIILFILLSACQEMSTTETQLTSRPSDSPLRVGTLYGPQIYISTKEGQYGFDYELAKRFALHLQLELNIKPYDTVSELYAALENNQIDIIAAGLTETPNRKSRFKFGPPLYHVDQILVYREGTPKPRMVTDIDAPIAVNADSAYVETLSQLQQQYPELTWQQLYGKDNDELLDLINKGELQYSITDSSSLLINRRLMPRLRQGPVLANDLPVVWLLPAENSDALMSRLLTFWNNVNKNGTLEHLNEKYFGHVKRFDYVDTRAFIRAIDSTLPKYEALFKTYAENLDWRKLAATSYQESHWNPKARSPTGVRGMMMLTQPTAKQVGISNRLDAEQSIKGGAIYLRQLLTRLPDSIPNNQRIWFALASYNLGLGHVEDARKLAQSQGLNPSAWRDVKQILPLLKKRKYYKKTRYGYARGGEAVHYVENIRRYYDTMVWLDSHSSHVYQKSQLSQTSDKVTSQNTITPVKESASQPD